MKDVMKKIVGISACALGLTYGATNALADCRDMGSDQWQQLNLAMASAFDAGNFEEALNNGKRMNIICDRSPVVNFTMSEIYRRMGNNAEAANYAKKSTTYIADYPVPQALAERIWMRRAEYELPYKQELDELKAKTADYDTIKADYEARVQAEKESAIRTRLMGKSTKDNWWGAMWAGVGIMGAGVVMTIAGGVLAARVDKVDYKTPDDSKNSGFRVRPSYIAGWTLIGLGIASTVGGTILTGIAGYRYTNFEERQKHIEAEINESMKQESENTISFQVSPTSVAFGMTF
jgi:hypothetical protein